MNTGYGLRGPLRAGAGEEDPGPGVFGSQERERKIIALKAQKMKDCCYAWIIAFGAKEIPEYVNKGNKVDAEDFSTF
ncbi:hypothetical protein [Enterobacter hormaechei]|uniref:hypothetical protein n=1 Tax=Enterobacter hormaechei TaxID=158836 RepID=UPI0006498310|nr:hypothetical protein [Enterobacter hormaechei]KLP69222.1 hypothetical protein ABF82_00630 [Enterobacter hormaechei subsp. steigerwaltii]